MAPSIYPFASFELKQPSVLVFPFVRRRDEEKRKWLDLSDARICGIFLSFFFVFFYSDGKCCYNLPRGGRPEALEEEIQIDTAW